MSLRESPIIVRLTLGFGLILLVTAVMGVAAVVSLRDLSDITRRLYDHPFTVSVETMQIRVTFARMEGALNALPREFRPEESQRLTRQIAEDDAEIGRRLALLRKRYLGPPDDVTHIESALTEWRSLRDHVLGLVRHQRFGEIDAILTGPGRDLAQAVDRETGRVIEFALNRARAFDEQARAEVRHSLTILPLALAGLTLAGLAVAAIITRGIVRPLDSLRQALLDIAEGRPDCVISLQDGPREVRAMAQAAEIFREAMQRLQGQGWVKARVSELAQALQRVETIPDFAATLIGGLVPMVGATAGLFHLWRSETGRFDPLGGVGLIGETRLRSLAADEGVIGRAMSQRVPVLLEEVPESYFLRIGSGLGEATPRLLLAVPVLSRGEVLGVIELAAFTPFTRDQKTLIDELAPVAGLCLDVLERNQRTRQLLAETRRQAEELRTSQEELKTQSEEVRAANDELRRQARELSLSEEELRAANEELIDKSRALEAAREVSDRRARELAEVSRYKSEFLANVSHELRTPLNSLMILSRDLADNREKTLTEEQLESARIIHDSGDHLLHLINDILDLSKIEAGRMELVLAEVHPADLAETLRQTFAAQATQRGLSLSVVLDDSLPATIRGDEGKILQVLINLVGNALKFTSRGGVTVRFRRVEEDGGQMVVTVEDSGIGIAADKIERVFLAFEQADGSTSRRFGGTGLGLSISRRLVELMGGSLRVDSVEGHGSTFTLSLPLVPSPLTEEPGLTNAPPPDIGRAWILIAETDDEIAGQIERIASRRGFESVRARTGDEVMREARRRRPAGILLDIDQPGFDGWTVLESLRGDPRTRSIPVHVLSAIDEGARGLEMGAAGILAHPVGRDQLDRLFEQLRPTAGTAARTVLIIDDDPVARETAALLVQEDRIVIRSAATGQEGLDALRASRFDCLILDLILPDIGGLELLDRARAEGIPLPPVVVHSAKDLGYAETLRLRDYTDSIVIKGARSPERLLDEVTLFLHSMHPVTPPEPSSDPAFAGLKVLVVDDDMRSAFALSKALRTRGFSVLVAEDGGKALTQIAENPDIGLVLMDIMMPVMDGCEAIAEIRRRPGGATLPILALSAKAMPGDRERCLQAGANDFLPKPVDIDRLLALIRHHLDGGTETTP